MNYLILGGQTYSPNSCPAQNSNGCGENDGCYKYDSCTSKIRNPMPCTSKSGGGCPDADFDQAP